MAACQTPPGAAPLRWILGAEGQSCNDACALAGRACAEGALGATNTESEAREAAEQAGHSCSSARPWSYQSNPGICTSPGCCGNGSCMGMCAFGSGGTAERGCSWKGQFGLYSRLCPCEHRDPGILIFRKQLSSPPEMDRCFRHGLGMGEWADVFAGIAPHAPGAKVSRFWQPEGNATLLVETDVSGWNNVRMSWETAVSLAYKTRRWYRVPHIQEYSDPRIMLNMFTDGLVSSKGRHPGLFDYYDEGSFRRVVPSMLDAEAVPCSAEPCFFPTADPFKQPLEELNHTNIVYKEGPEHQDTRVFAQYAGLDRVLSPIGEYVRLIESAFRVRWPIICRAAARLVSHGLAPLGYVAIHWRRGDFLSAYFSESNNPEMHQKLEPKVVAAHVEPLVRNRTVLILTDDYDGATRELIHELHALSGAARVICWADAERHGEEAVFGAQIDMLSAVAAEQFIGSPLSTFSTGIIRWRKQAGTHAVGRPVHFVAEYDPGHDGWNAIGAPGTYL